MSTSAATTTVIAAAAPSLAIRTRRRSHRSTRAPAKGPSTIPGAIAAKKRMPNASAEPVRW